MRNRQSIRYSLCSLFVAMAIVCNLGMMAEAAELVIFHTNDMHARVVAEDDNGHSIGLSEMAAVVKAEKAKNPYTLWLDAGDTFHGMPRINVSKGQNMVTLLNLAGMDAVVPGNHDFNYGFRQLEKLASGLRFPLLSANTVWKGTQQKVFKECQIYDFPDGTKVGVFGLSTPETAFKTNPNNVKEIEFLNPVDTAKLMVQKLRSKCDVLIAVMHMGVDQSSEFTSERIAREVSGIDLIVDGHSHTELQEGMKVNDTLIVQTGWHEYNLGRVTLDVENHQIKDKKATLLSKSTVLQKGLKPDPMIEKAMKKIDKKNSKLFGEVVAHTDRSLSAERLLVRRQETELGNLCSDALRWRTGADLAVMNGGGMRSDLPKGNVTRGDIMAIFPFGNTIQVAEISGKNIREMLEHSVYGYPASFGGFLHVSGMTFTFDSSLPVGSRVSDIRIGGEPLDENRVYHMAATDFLFVGGDDYDMLKGLHIVGEFDTCEGTLADYLNKVGMPDIQVGRITVNNSLPPLASELEEGGKPAASSGEQAA